MAAPRKRARVPELTAKESQEFIKIIDAATMEFSGVFDDLENASGC
jgi:hypothetical protein